MSKLKEPVMIVMDGKYLVHAGQPDTFNKKTISEYAQKGYQIKTIEIEKFRNREWTWIYDKGSRGQNNKVPDE